jgi:hypothetical protein
LGRTRLRPFGLEDVNVAHECEEEWTELAPSARGYFCPVVSDLLLILDCCLFSPSENDATIAECRLFKLHVAV